MEALIRESSCELHYNLVSIHRDQFPIKLILIPNSDQSPRGTNGWAEFKVVEMIVA
jgi:hypothetical protein